MPARCQSIASPLSFHCLTLSYTLFPLQFPAITTIYCLHFTSLQSLTIQDNPSHIITDVYEVAAVVANYSVANIPLETMWTDIDYMDFRKVFTLDPLRFPLNLMQQLVDYLHTHQQHYIVMVDPAVAYQDYPAFNNGVDDNAFLKVANGSIYKGVVWPGVTAFPDWFAPGTQGYWNGEFDSFFDPTNGVDIDALW